MPFQEIQFQQLLETLHTLVTQLNNINYVQNDHKSTIEHIKNTINSFDIKIQDLLNKTSNFVTKEEQSSTMFKINESVNGFQTSLALLKQSVEHVQQDINYADEEHVKHCTDASTRWEKLNALDNSVSQLTISFNTLMSSIQTLNAQVTNDKKEVENTVSTTKQNLESSINTNKKYLETQIKEISKTVEENKSFLNTVKISWKIIAVVGGGVVMLVSVGEWIWNLVKPFIFK